MRRLLLNSWTLAPLVLALLYTGAHALLAPRPDVGSVVPREAVVTARFRGRESLDRLWFLGRPPEGRPSESIGRQRNVPNLDGVNAAGAFHFVLVPRGPRADNSLFVFPLSDADAFRSEFDGVLDEGGRARRLERQAQHLEIHGEFAAVAWDRGLVQHLGEGGLTSAERGEDLALAVNVPEAALLVTGSAGSEPFRSIAVALGAEPWKTTYSVDRETGQRRADMPAGRLPLVASAWTTARLWVWSDARRMEAELTPVPGGALARLLAAAHGRPAPSLQGAPKDALAWFELADGPALAAVAQGLHDAGVRMPDLPGLSRLAEQPAPPGARAPGGPGLRGWMLPNESEGNAWTVVVEAEPALLSALAPLMGELPGEGARRELAAGEAPFTLSNLRGSALPPPATLLTMGSGAAGRRALLLGVDAPRHAARLALAPPPEALAPWPDPEGLTLLARFGLSAQRAPDVLGGALTEGGLLVALAGGAIEGEVATDGVRLRVRLRVAGR